MHLSGSSRVLKSKPKSEDRLPGLTGLRFLAALAIVIVHFGFSLAPAGPLRTLASHGDIGVSLFFVLSGFILSYRYLGKGSKEIISGGYWISRFARIYPIYLASLCFALIPTLWLTGMNSSSFLGTLLLVQSWNFSWATWDPPSWSLSAEAFFYLCFPFAGVYFSRLATTRLYMYLPIFWAVSLTLIALSHSLGIPYEISVYHPLFRLPEFGFGMILGLLFVRCGRLPIADAVAVLTVLVLGAVVIIVGPVFSRAAINAGLLTPLLGALVYSTASSKGIVARVLGNKWMLLLGEASYSLYLLHVPLWDWLTRFIGTSTHTPDAAVFFAAYLVLAITLAIVAYQQIEVPARRTIFAALSRQR